MSKEQEVAEDFADDFDVVEEDVVAKETDGGDVEEPKPKKKTQMLADNKILDGAKEAYLSHITNILPLKLGLDPSKKYTAEEVWDLAPETDRQGVNKVYRVKGQFGAGGGGDVEPKSKAHAKALALKKEIRDGAYGYIKDNLADQFNELQGLVPLDAKGKPVAPISIEIYFKNDKKFVASLPPDED